MSQGPSARASAATPNVTQKSSSRPASASSTSAWKPKYKRQLRAARTSPCRGQNFLTDRIRALIFRARARGVNMGVVRYRCPNTKEEVTTAIETGNDVLFKMRSLDLTI